MFKKLLVLTLIFVAISADWTPIDWKTLPPAQPNDKIIVYYLVAPLLEDSFGSLLKYLDVFHGALAFLNTASNFSITINYDANDFFRASLFPEIITATNGTKYLRFDNGGANFIYAGINETYWTEGVFEVTTINGSIYNQFMNKWNPAVNETWPYYNMFSVLDYWGGTVFLPSWDCFDFVWETFVTLSTYGAPITNNVTFYRNFVNIYSSAAPQDVTSLYNSDPTTREQIIEFYEFIEAEWSDLTLVELFLELWDTFDGVFYLRYSGLIYQLQLNFPPFGVDWESVSPLETL